MAADEVWTVLLVVWTVLLDVKKCELYCGLWRSVNCIVVHKKECWWQGGRGARQRKEQHKRHKSGSTKHRNPDKKILSIPLWSWGEGSQKRIFLLPDFWKLLFGSDWKWKVRQVFIDRRRVYISKYPQSSESPNSSVRAVFLLRSTVHCTMDQSHYSCGR